MKILIVNFVFFTFCHSSMPFWCWPVLSHRWASTTCSSNECQRSPSSWARRFWLSDMIWRPERIATKSRKYNRWAVCQIDNVNHLPICDQSFLRLLINTLFDRLILAAVYSVRPTIIIPSLSCLTGKTFESEPLDIQNLNFRSTTK